jgi:hypothetical protein
VEVFLLIAGVLVGVGAAAFAEDRLLLWMEGRGWVYWRRTKTLSSIGAGLVQEADPAAGAARRAMEQERVRKNVRPAEDPPFHVDLEAKTVRIRLKGRDERSKEPPS